VGVQFVGWGGCEISFGVCRRGVDRVYLGVLLKYLSCLLLTVSIGYIFDDVLSYIGNYINPSNAELNPIYHLLALLGARHILHVSRTRVNMDYVCKL